MSDHSWDVMDHDVDPDLGQTKGALDNVANVALHAWGVRPVIAGATGLLITAVAAPLAPLAPLIAMPLSGVIDGLFTDDHTKKAVDRVSFATAACRFGGALDLFPSNDADLLDGASVAADSVAPGWHNS